MKTLLVPVALLLSLAVTAQEPWPRFRAGANLDSVDATTRPPRSSTAAFAASRSGPSGLECTCARPGYLAPTETEADAAGGPAKASVMPPGTERIARRSEMTALRRGLGMGVKFVAAGEPRFRRTERLRIEVAMPAEATGATGRVLTAQAQTMPLIVSYSTQQTGGRLFGIAEVALSPLAVGQYQLELS